jgi:hypothetical protein
VSGNDLDVDHLDHIKKIVEYNGFPINNSKTQILRRKKIITGVSISSGKTMLPKDRKRKLRQEVHFLVKNGIEYHFNKLNIRDPLYLERLIGKLSFWKLLEPNNEFVKTSIEKLNKIRKSPFANEKTTPQ